MLSTIVTRRWKIKRKHWLKQPSKVVPPKKKLDQIINDSKCHILLKILVLVYYFFIFILMFQRTSSKFFFFDFRFSRRKSQSRQKLLIKITYFAIQVCSKHLTHFTNLNPLDIENNMLPKHCQNSFSLYNFFRKHVSCVRKNICTVPFLDTQELHSWSTLEANDCIFLCI